MPPPSPQLRQVSVSLGTRALPDVKAAVDHATQNKDHDPIVFLILTDQGQQQTRWYCEKCMQINGLPYFGTS